MTNKSLIKELFANKLALLAAASLIILYFFMVSASFIAPYDPLERNPIAGSVAPSRIYLDSQGLYIYNRVYEVDNSSYEKKSKELHSDKFYIKFLRDAKLFSVEKPAYIYLLGTDSIGRDLFSRLIYGSIPSLTIGFLGLIIAFPLGVLYGGISGYLGGRIDNLMMRVAEAIMSLPSFYLLVILSAILPASLNNFQRFAMITFILSFISWAGLARIIRGLVLSIKEKEFIESARSVGQKDFMIVVKHLIPHTFSFLIVAITLSIPSFVIGESALSFLGLGINQPDPSWGNILAEGKELSNILTRPWLIWAPSLLIFLTVFSYNILGDFLRDFFDTKLD
jgi:peptide/nickel transport system permease protein